MIGKLRIFGNDSRGGMLVELMLCIALAMAIIPFVFRYQQNIVARAANIAVADEMARVQTALERYIMTNRAQLLRTVGRDIIRVNLEELLEYGLDQEMISKQSEKYQLRVLKSVGTNGRGTLQGIVVLADGDISPMRTREIANLSGGEIGFVDGRNTYGAFGAWRTDNVDLGVAVSDGIVGTTSVNRDNAMYLWRVPSENSSDATMMADLNLGGHDVLQIKNVDTRSAEFQEIMTASEISADSLIFQNRTSIDNNYVTQNAMCSGILSSDARSMQVEGNMYIADLAKFSSFTTNDLWVSNLNLSGFSTSSASQAATIKINQTLDMTGGRVDALYATVGFSGSVSPRVVVKQQIRDSSNPDYFWDFSSGTANLGDLSLAELNQMAPQVLRDKSARNTQSYQVFSGVTTNKNATVSDYLNAINDIQTRVRAKYSQLQLQ